MTFSARTVGGAVRAVEKRLAAAKLVHGHGAETPPAEAHFLVFETLGLPSVEPERFLDMRLTVEEKEAIKAVTEERVRTRRPAAYIARKMYLQGLPFYVDERVIVPRSFIAELLPDFPLDEEPRSVLDLCTGSGCLAILAAYLYPDARVDAVELSKDAAAVARRNIEDHRLEKRVTLFEGDLFAPLKKKKYDLIITNPPYVTPASMKRLPPEYRHEPAMALAGGGADGMDIVRRILKGAKRHLNPGGGLICEVGDARSAVEKSFPRLPFLWLETENSADEVFWLEAGTI